MCRMRAASLLIALTWMSIACIPALAQDAGEDLDMIVVTGSRVGYRELQKTPAIFVTKPGDFLLQNIVLINDSREPTARRRELHETIAKLIAASAGRYRILHNGAYRTALDRNNYQIEPEEDEDRPDSSLVNLQVRTDLGGDPARADEVIAAMRRFIRDAARVGRTEIDLDGESGLAMNRPERFRYEIVDAIARDSQRLLEVMAMQCRIELEGLNSRIEWQRVSAAELLLYIPYTMSIGDCRKTAP